MSDSAPQSVRSSASNHGRIVTENPSLLSLLKEKTDDKLNRQSTHTHGGARSNSRNQDSQREKSQISLNATNKHIALDSNRDSHTFDDNIDSHIQASTQSIADIAENNIYKGKVKTQVKNAEEDSALDLGFDSPAPEAPLQTYRVPSPVSQVIPYIESPNNFRDSLEEEEKGETTAREEISRELAGSSSGEENNVNSVREKDTSENSESDSETKRSDKHLHPEFVDATPRHATPRHERFSAGHINTRTSTSSVYAVANPSVLVAQGDTPVQQNVQFTPRVESKEQVSQSPAKDYQTNDETGEINKPSSEKSGSGKSNKTARVSFKQDSDQDSTDRDTPVDGDITPTNWDTQRSTEIQERVPTPHPSSPLKSPIKSPEVGHTYSSRKSPEPADSNTRRSNSRTSNRQSERESPARSESKGGNKYNSEKLKTSLPTVKRVYIDSPTFTKEEENEYRFVESRLEEGNDHLDKTFRELEHTSPKRHKISAHKSKRKMDDSYSAQKSRGHSDAYAERDDRYDEQKDSRNRNYDNRYEQREEDRASYGDQFDRRSNHARDNDQYDRRSNHARDNDQYDRRSNHARDNDQYDKRSNHARDNDQYDRRSNHARDNDQYDRRSNHARDNDQYDRRSNHARDNDQYDRRSNHARDEDRGSYADEYAKRDDRGHDRDHRHNFDTYEGRDDRDNRENGDRFTGKSHDRDRRQSVDRYGNPVDERDVRQNGDRYEDRVHDRDREDRYRNNDRYEDRNEKMEESRSRHSGQYRQQDRDNYDRRRVEDTPSPRENYARQRFDTNMDDDLEKEREYQAGLRQRIDSQSKKDSELVIPKLPLNMESEDYVQDSLDYDTVGNNDWGNPPPNPYGGYEERGNPHDGYHQQRRQQYNEQHDSYQQRQRGVQGYIDQLDTARMEILNPSKPKYDYVENNKVDYGRVHDKSYRNLVQKRKEAEDKLDKYFFSPKNKPKQQRQLNKAGENRYFSPLADFHSEQQMSTAEEMWAKRSAALSKKKTKTASGTIKKSQGLQKYPSDSGLFRLPGQPNGVRMYGTPTRNHFLEPMEQRPPPPPQNDPYNREPLPLPQARRSPPFKKPLELKPITQQIVTEDGQKISVDINLKVVSPPPPHSNMGPPQFDATVVPRPDPSPDRRPTGQQYQLPYLQQDQAELMTTYGQYEDVPPLPPPQHMQQPQYGGDVGMDNQPHYQQGYYGYDDTENIPPQNMDVNRQVDDGGYGQTDYNPYNTVPPIKLDEDDLARPGHFDENGYAAMYKREKEKNPNDQPWYQVYTIKDYRKMVKEVKLNRGTLGPDLDNETYKEKLEKRYKQIDYARMVMEKNRQDYGDRKPPSFPKPKDTNLEEAKKRQAALDYAKNVPKPVIKQKPNQYNSYEVASQLSPVNKRRSPVQKVQTQTIDVIDLKKLKQRHEQDKQNVASIRQNVEA